MRRIPLRTLCLLGVAALCLPLSAASVAGAASPPASAAAALAPAMAAPVARSGGFAMGDGEVFGWPSSAALLRDDVLPRAGYGRWYRPASVSDVGKGCVRTVFGHATSTAYRKANGATFFTTVSLSPSVPRAEEAFDTAALKLLGCTSPYGGTSVRKVSREISGVDEGFVRTELLLCTTEKTCHFKELSIGLARVGNYVVYYELVVPPSGFSLSLHRNTLLMAKAVAKLRAAEGIASTP